MERESGDLEKSEQYLQESFKLNGGKDNRNELFKYH